MKIIAKFQKVNSKRRAFRYLLCSKLERPCKPTVFKSNTQRRQFYGKYKLPKLPQEREAKIEQIGWHGRSFKSQRCSFSPPKNSNVYVYLKNTKKLKAFSLKARNKRKKGLLALEIFNVLKRIQPKEQTKEVKVKKYWKRRNTNIIADIYSLGNSSKLTVTLREW